MPRFAGWAAWLGAWCDVVVPAIGRAIGHLAPAESSLPGQRSWLLEASADIRFDLGAWPGRMAPGLAEHVVGVAVEWCGGGDGVGGEWSGGAPVSRQGAGCFVAAESA